MREETGERESRPAPPSAPVPESREHPRAAWTARQMEARDKANAGGEETAAALILMCSDGGR